MGLFHVTTRAAWDRALADGEYRPASLDREGRIRLANDRQWLAIANRLHRGQRDLVLLSIRRDRVGSLLRDETSNGETFPCLYGPLDIASVVECCELPCDDAGAIGIPAALAPWRSYFE